VPNTDILSLNQRTDTSIYDDEFIVAGNPNEKITLAYYKANFSDISSGEDEKFVTPQGLPRVQVFTSTRDI